MLSGSLSPRHAPSSGCGWRRQPPDMEGSCQHIGINTVLNGSLSPRHGPSSGCGWRTRPTDMESSCEYIQGAVAEIR